MIRTGEQYKEGIRDGREVWVDGERVKDVTMHPALKPIIDIKARMYDMAREDRYAADLTYVENNETHSIFYKPPTEQKDWHDKIKAVDSDVDGVLTADEHAKASASMFAKMDADKDGFLSKQEMAAGHAAMMKKQ